MLSVSFVLPVIGRFYDEGITARLPHGVTAKALEGALDGAPAGNEAAAQWAAIQAQAGLESLGWVAVLPAVLAVIFLVLVVAERKRSKTAE